MPALLDAIAESFTPTCTCCDGVRAVATILDALKDSETYRAGYAAGRADLVAEQLAVREDRALAAQAAGKRWDRNAKASWWADCACAGCKGAPVDGWCRCVFCQVAGFVGEQVFRDAEHDPYAGPFQVTAQGGLPRRGGDRR